MVKTQASTVIAKPTDHVFDFIAVDFFDNYRRWSPEVLSLELLSSGPVQVGTLGRQVRVDHGRRTEATFKVTAFERDRRIDFQGISDPFFISYQFEGMADRTRLTFIFELSRLEFFMRPFEKLIHAAVHEGAERIVRNIKGLIETEDTRSSRP